MEEWRELCDTVSMQRIVKKIITLPSGRKTVGLSHISHMSLYLCLINLFIDVYLSIYIYFISLSHKSANWFMRP